MKINKTLTLSIVGFSAVLLGGCIKKEPSVVTVKDPEKIASMVEAGEPMHCVMNTTEGGSVETWTKGEKIKVYSDSMVEGVGMGYMISDGEWTYVWTEGKTEGTKYPIVDEDFENEEFQDEDFVNESPSFDMQEELDQHMVDDYEYECNNEKISDSIFAPPSSIEFVDVMKEMEEKMGIMMDDLQKSGGSLEDYK